MRVAVVGSGISGLAAAYELANAGIKVSLYEKEDILGGQPRTVTVESVDIDLQFMVFNRVTYPNMMNMFETLGIEMEVSDMSFSVSLNGGNDYEWGSRKGLASLFSQKSNIVNPHYWYMLREISKFKNDVIRYLKTHEGNTCMDRSETLELFIKSHGYSHLFQRAFLIPLCASIWSCPLERVMNFSAYTVLSFCCNHHLLQLFGQPQWFIVKFHSQSYINKVKAGLESRCCQIKLGCEVKSVSSIEKGCSVLTSDLSEELYDRCIISTHAPDALKIIKSQITPDESRILGAFQYIYSDVYLHHDGNLMPQNQYAWSARNFLGTKGNGVFVTYWLNVLQNLESTGPPFLVTLNPPCIPKYVVMKWICSHPVPSVAASKASLELEKIQGKRGIWFCGAFQGYGFEEDGVKAGLVAARDILGKELKLLKSPKHMVPSLMEAGMRLIVTKFLNSFISTGSLTLLEEGGTIFVFEGKETNNCCVHMKSVLKVQNSSFYWKIATEADIGLASAYINGDFSFVDEKNGLLDLLLVLIANRDLRNLSNHNNDKRGWWTPLLLTSGIASAKYFFQHVSRPNSTSLARRNISLHYDLSNEFFSLFLDETMQYSCAIFKDEDEELREAQLRKIRSLIDKAMINERHHVLEIGCGWGSLPIELVKRTGCRYTGITLSVEHLKYCKRRVEEAGLEDRITLLLCDYRQLPSSKRYDRIISCEMIEHVGHEYFEEFFCCCEELLADGGLCVLQFIYIPDQRYEEYRRSSDFIKEYIFHGGCLPSLNRITSAMAASSKLCVEHLENVGIHYYQTLMHWRKNLLSNKHKILSLGFDEKFIRTWEYYFVYCAAGFKSRTLGDYQMVLSRPGNLKTFNNPFEGIPAAY